MMMMMMMIMMMVMVMMMMGMLLRLSENFHLVNGAKVRQNFEYMEAPIVERM